MSDPTTPTMDSGEPSELEQLLQMTKRSFVRLFLGSAAAYSVPLMASFSMEGLGIGKAHGQSVPPGLLFAGTNQGISNFPFERYPFLGPNQPGNANPPGINFPD
jgi:hypothetical protein